MRGHFAAAAGLTARTEALDEALAVAGSRLDEDVAAKVEASIAGVRERLALGVDHTLVALVGGTGSGKSSLFNAITGLQFADVGVKRPTTAAVTACVWGGTAEALLDWLEVAPDRRIERESALDGDTEAPLRGLVLLDLPDHDSIEPAHRVVVDRLLPMVDLLVWVVDPQKYADDALHSGYLRHLVGHELAMAVVMNHIDTVRPEQRDRLLADLTQLLVDDGLTGVPVLSASAREGLGIAEIRERLAGVVSRRSTAAQRAGAELNDAADLLRADVGPQPAATAVHPGETGATTPSTRAVVDIFVEAAGLPAVADAVAAVVRGAAGSVPPIGAVQQGTVELARSRWLASLAGSAPDRWLADIAARVSPGERLRLAADAALSALALAARRSRLSVVLSWLAVIALAAGVAGGVLATDRWDVPDVTDRLVVPVWVVAAAAGALAIVLGVLAALARRSAARRRADAVLRDGRRALEGVVDVHLVQPTCAVLAERARVLQLVADARSRTDVEPTSASAPTLSSTT